MEVSVSGKVSEVRDEHSAKAAAPMEVMLFGKVIEVRDVQPLKALFPMVVTGLPL